MKTTKEDRDAFVEESVELFKKNSQFWKVKFVQELADDVSWAEKMLIRAKILICVECDDRRHRAEKTWLEDLKKGPQ